MVAAIKSHVKGGVFKRRKKMLEPAEVNSPPAARTAPCPRPPRTRPASHLLTRLIRVAGQRLRAMH